VFGRRALESQAGAKGANKAAVRRDQEISMSMYSWLIFLMGGGLFLAFCALVTVTGPGTLADRVNVIRESISKVFSANKRIVFIAVLGMLALNSFFSLFPVQAGATAEELSASEQGRLMMALILYLFLNGGWFAVLMRASKVIYKNVQKL